MILAGFDIATQTGAAVNNEKLITTHTFKPKAKRPIELKQTEVFIPYEAAIALEFRLWSRSFLIAHGIQCVGFEKPADRSFERTETEVNTQSLWAGQAITKVKKPSSSLLTLIRANILACTLDEVCQSLNIETYIFPASDWRMSFIGVGRAPKHLPKHMSSGRDWLKEQAKLKARAMGIDVKNDDEAEAVGVVEHLRAVLFPQKFAAADNLFNLPPSRVGSSATASG